MALLDDVKTGLGITGEYQDGTLSLYISEVKEYLKAAGIPAETVESAAAVGTITRGVADLWNYGAGEGTFSEYFMQRAIQLKLKSITAGKTNNESGAAING